MKKLFALVLAALFGLALFSAPILADGGDDTPGDVIIIGDYQ